jgi:uncharacterized protein
MNGQGDVLARPASGERGLRMRRMLLVAVLVSVSGVPAEPQSVAPGEKVPPTRGGPSFDCRKAASPTEKAICGSAELSGLDSRMAAAWKRSIQVFADADALLAPLRTEQREWVAKRNACGASVSCLENAYLERTAVLEFRPAPKATPVDGFVGNFDHEGFMTVSIQRSDATSARVLIDGSDPVSGRWTCHFEGIGTVKGNRLEAAGFETEGKLILERDGDGIKIPDLDSNLAANQGYCGLNGAMTFTFRRAPQSKSEGGAL